MDNDVQREVNHKDDSIDPIYQKPLVEGLLPGEIILMYWLDRKHLDSSFPGYFKYQYGIDTKTSAKKLFKKGFVSEASIAESLSSLKVPELKDILRKHNLKVSGRKAELIKRIQHHLSETDMRPFLKQRPLKITEKGQSIIEVYDYIIHAHRYNSQNGTYHVAEAIKFVKETNDKNPRGGDIAWALYQKALSKHHRNLDFGLYRNVHSGMAEQLEREEKKKDALMIYLEICILDLSGLGNSGYIMKPDLVFLAPGILRNIESLCDEKQIEENSLKGLFEQAWKRILPSLPFHYLDQEMCFKSLKAGFKEDESFIKEIVTKAYKEIDRKTFESRYGLKLPLEY